MMWDQRTCTVNQDGKIYLEIWKLPPYPGVVEIYAMYQKINAKDKSSGKYIKRYILYSASLVCIEKLTI